MLKAFFQSFTRWIEENRHKRHSHLQQAKRLGDGVRKNSACRKYVPLRLSLVPYPQVLYQFIRKTYAEGYPLLLLWCG